jgi:hypothetical protein
MTQTSPGRARKARASDGNRTRMTSLKGSVRLWWSILAYALLETRGHETTLSPELPAGTAPPMLIPWDCADGFLEAYWRRPEAYL